MRSYVAALSVVLSALAGEVGAQPVPTGSPFVVNTNVADIQDEPAVAAGVGGFVVVWHTFPHEDGNDSGIVGRRYDASGAPLGPSFVVNTYTTSAQSSPDVAVRGDGTFVVVWQSLDQVQVGSDVFGQRFDAGGAPLGAEFPVDQGGLASHSAQVSWEPSGGFVVVWDGGHDSFGRRFDGSGIPLGVEFLVNTYTTGFQDYPQVVGGPGGGFVVSWHGAGPGGSGVFARLYDGTGAALGPEFAVTSAVAAAPTSIAADAANGFVVAWTTKTGSDVNISARRFDVTGTALGPEQLVGSTGSIFAPSPPEVTVDPSGRHLIAWQTSTDDELCPDGLAGRFYDASGAPEGPAFDIACEDLLPPFPQRPQAAAFGGQRYVITWDGHGEQGYDVSARLFGFDAPLTGSRLVLQDPNVPTARKVVMRLQGDYLSTQPGAGIDPLADGLALQVFNGAGSGEAACFTLPAAAWVAKGDPARPTFKYTDPEAIFGPCKAVTIKHGKMLKATCRALVQPIPYSLDEAQQEAMAVRATSGGVTYCADFGGVLVDVPGRFKAKGAPAPTSCQVPPMMCP